MKEGRKLGLGTSGLSAEHQSRAGCRGGEEKSTLLCSVGSAALVFCLVFSFTKYHRIKSSRGDSSGL